MFLNFFFVYAQFSWITFFFFLNTLLKFIYLLLLLLFFFFFGVEKALSHFMFGVVSFPPTLKSNNFLIYILYEHIPPNATLLIKP